MVAPLLCPPLRRPPLDRPTCGCLRCAAVPACLRCCDLRCCDLRCCAPTLCSRSAGAASSEHACRHCPQQRRCPWHAATPSRAAQARSMMLRLAATLASPEHGGLEGACLFGSVLLHELLRDRCGIASRLRQGYVVFRLPAQGAQCLWHVWLEAEGEQLDVGHELWLRALQRRGVPPEQVTLMADNKVLLPAPPADAVRLDAETEADRAQLREAEAGWARLRTDDLEGTYWRHAPAPFRVAAASARRACSTG